MIIVLQLVCYAGSNSGGGNPRHEGFDQSSTSAKRTVNYCRMINTQSISQSCSINKTNGCGHGNDWNEDDTGFDHNFDVVHGNEEVRPEMMTMLVDVVSFIDAE